MKRLGVLFLSSVFIFNGVGPFLKFALLHHRIAQEMQHYILYHTSKELYTVTVTPENAKLIHWQHQHEFSYHGIMFDVVEKVVIDAKTTIYHCVADYKETALFSDFDHFIKKHTHPKGHFKIPVFNLIQLFPQGSYLEDQVTVTWATKVQQCWGDLRFYGSPHLDKITPPPEQERLLRMPLPDFQGIVG